MEGEAGTAEAVEATAPAAEATPAPEAPAPPAAEPPDYVSELLSDSPPAFIEALDAAAQEEGVETWKVPRPDFNDLPPEVGKVVHNLRNLALRKSSEAARIKQEVEAQRAELEAQRAALQQEQQQLLSMFKNPALLEGVGSDLPAEPPDKWADPDGYAEWKWQQKLQGQWQELVGRLGKISDEAKAEAEAALAARQRERKIAEVQAWIEATPDFEVYEDRIVEMVKNHKIPAKRAYELLKAEDIAKQRQGAPTPDSRREAVEHARHAMRVGRGGVGEIPPTPNFGGDLHKLHEWYDQHPGAMERDAKELERKLARG